MAAPLPTPEDAAPEPIQWFEDSRRLTGPNLFFAQTGAVLDARGPGQRDTRVWKRWQELVESSFFSVFGPLPSCFRPRVLRIREHSSGPSLALAAPLDQLYTATELNEWAWERATWEVMPEAWQACEAPRLPMEHEEALRHLRARAHDERSDALRGLVQTATDRDLSVILDDSTFTLGSGCFSRSYALASPLDETHQRRVTGLPDAAHVPWAALGRVPTALITGTNGKTTTTRLVAAMARAHGWRTGLCSTGGVQIDGAADLAGDYAGPAGARTVLRDMRVQCAVLETARGGMLRRGLACADADVAVVTNISPDHFGEWGIDHLAHLGEAKLIVAHAVRERGTLVLNADCEPLMQAAAALQPPVGRRAYFSLDDAHPRLQALRAEGGSTCGVADGRLMLSLRTERCDLGVVADMPLTAGCAATYNIANTAAAALVAAHIGIPPDTIAKVLAQFGASPADNPGRLNHLRIGCDDGQAPVHVLLDYAHNPEGLAALLEVAQRLRQPGARLGLLLGQAGNRTDADIAALAAVAAAVQPEYIALKELPAMLRGRQLGEVPALLESALVQRGFAADRILSAGSEPSQVRHLVAWATPGDVLVLPLHESSTSAQTMMWLTELP